MKSIAVALLLFTRLTFAADQTANTFYQEISSDPGTLNPVTASDVYARYVYGYVYDQLLTNDPDTFEWKPNLAVKWVVSKDGKKITYTLREGVKWSDGQPFTAEDVKYSYDVFFEGRFDGASLKSYLDNLKEVKIIDPKTVEFTFKEVYYKNFEVISSYFSIIPKHFYGTGDPKDPKFNKTMIGTGPYLLEEWNKGTRVVLKKNPNYFGSKDEFLKKFYNFDRIFYRIVKESAVALELLKKGDIDYIYPMRAEDFVTKTKGEEWGKKVIAVKATNNHPDNYNYGYIGWNQKNPLFKDRDVRVALSHLINRDFMIEKFRYGLSEKAVGPFGNKSPASSSKVKAIAFDPKKAMELLKGNGWKLGDKGLTKNIDGKDTVFEFTLLSANPDFEKYLTIIKEDMKKVGITMNIKIIEFNNMLKLMDERKYDAMTLSWSVGSLEQDPKQIFHSSAIPTPGDNFVSYNSPELDKVIDQLRVTMDKNKRRTFYHKAHEIIAADQPYSFFFNSKFTLYANTTRIKKQKDTFKFDVGKDTWKIAP